MISAYRIVKGKHLKTAFSGEGARRFGGRWNSPGIPMVYVSESVSVAVLETLVHIDDVNILYDNFWIIPAELPEDLIESPSIESLPSNWNSVEVSNSTHLVGDQWFHGKSSPILKVPSAAVQLSSNYLINPMHPKSNRIQIGEPFRLEPDPRLSKQ